MKYKLTDETIVHDRHILCRIECVEAFDNVWVYGDVQTYDNVEVFGDVKVYRRASVSGDAIIFSDTKVYDNIKISDNTNN